ncbi:restriction endonuclease subunit S [Salmonella enterica subsp. salamae]|nr:restriction endonuclease subunit S [Salmonella enterica subsp. salamae]SQH42299.1 restriction endonuclease [Salmonella enterica]
MSELRTVKLNELAAPGRSVISGPFGSNIGQRFFQDAGVPVIRGNNLTTDFRKFNDEGFVFLTEEKADELKSDAIRGDILFTAAGTIGQVGMIPKSSKYDRYVISNKQLRFRVNPEIADPEYVYYWLASPWIYKTILSRNTGSTVPLINLGVIKSLPVSLPESIIEQRKISRLFSLIDEKITLNNRINTELEAMAKTLYDYWFVQFDFPDANGKPYKTSGGKMVYNATLKREIPAGWTSGTLDDLGQIVGGSTPSTGDSENFTVKGISWITPNDLSDNQGNKFISHGALDVSEEGIKNASLKKYPAGTVLLSSRAPIGYMAIAKNEVTTNQGFKSFIPSKGYSTEFVFYAVKNSLPVIVKNASGSTFKEVSGSVLKRIEITLPEMSVVNEYTKTVISIFSRQSKLELENQQLAALRDWLLPLLMNGQVTVK